MAETGTATREVEPATGLRRGADIADRLLLLAATVVRLARKLPRDGGGRHVASQLVRSGTSAGANYEEARAAESRADFIHKLRIAAKETRETIFWLSLVQRSAFLPSVVVAQSGPEALRLLMRTDFSVILLDVTMPIMDGFEVATLIRGRAKSAHTPIIFVTAHNATERFVQRGYSLGAVDYIFSPVMPSILRAKISVFIELDQNRRKLEEHARALARLNTQAWRGAFTRARDGLEALARIRGEQTPRLERPFLMITDLEMPRMDGLELLNRLRLERDHRDAIVFIHAAGISENSRKAAYEAHAAGVVDKLRSGPDFRDFARLVSSYAETIEAPL